MNETERKVFFARNIQELFYQKKTISALQVIGACTHLEHLPEKSISTTLIPELRQIHKHERFIEFGPGVTLAEIMALGERHIPSILYQAVCGIANPFVRNIATIGGNICAGPQRLSLFAPLLALDTLLELRSPSETSYISLQNFKSIPKDFVLTNIRIPLNDWDVSIYNRLGPSNKITENSAGFAFLADSEKNIITNIRIAFSGPITFRCIAIENKLLGLRLPLNEKMTAQYSEEAVAVFDETAEKKSYPPILRQQFQNLIRYAFEQLT